MSCDSFRGHGKEGLKTYQENSNLAEFAQGAGKPESPIEKADETSLSKKMAKYNNRQHTVAGYYI